MATSNRRQFMLSSLAGTAAGTMALGPPAASGMEPVQRTGGAHFKFSLAAYSYRDLLQGDPPRLSMMDFIEDCARFGLDGTEPTSYYFPDPLTEEFLRELKGAAFRLGLDISGTAVRNDFCYPVGERREQEIAHVKRWIEYADMMDAPVIRIFAGKIKEGQSLSEAQRLTIAGIEECCLHAAKHGVFLALENHGGITAQADDMLEIVRGVDSPWFGVNLDTGNFRTTDVYGDLAKLAPYALNVQVKVVIQPEGKTSEPSDFVRLADMLRASGYCGYIVLEFEEDGDPREECRKYADQLREAFA